ncbi:MAG: alpha/beta hydrolase [Pseudomonadota bacterium]
MRLHHLLFGAAAISLATACANEAGDPETVEEPPQPPLVEEPGPGPTGAPPPGPGMPKVDMSSIAEQEIDVAYASDSDDQKLDVFMPEGDGPFPAVVLIHGGAFKMGSKEMDYNHAKLLVENGYVAISINYRLSGEAVFPAAVHDCKAAIRFIRANADKYKIDPDKMGAWGASAGGNLTAMMATSAGDEFADGSVGEHTDVPTKIQAGINWFGPINFQTQTEEGLALGLGEDYNVDLESEYIGVDANDPANAELVAKANPTTYLDPSDPPIWTVVGDSDPLIPYTQSYNFYLAAKEVLGEDKATYLLLEGAGHGGGPFAGEELLLQSVAYFDKHLKN